MIFKTATEDLLFLVFSSVMTIFLLLDLFVLHRKSVKTTALRAVVETSMWVCLALCFGVMIYFYIDTNKSYEFFSAYLTEYALSMDNIFVILLILRYFKIHEEYYHNILFWGVFGAIVFRGIFIFLGATLIHEFHWIIYIFGAFLFYTGLNMFFGKSDDPDFDPSNSRFLKFIKSRFNFTSTYQGGKFFIKENGVWLFTVPFMALLLIESTDLIFAVDSIPAVFGISDDEFIVYTSNMFAVMGLRSMFFLLSGIVDKFHLLPKGLSLVLVFIGVKMLLGYFSIAINDLLSLLIILMLLLGSVLLSLIIKKN